MTAAIVKVPTSVAGRTSVDIDSRTVANGAGTGGLARRQVVALAGGDGTATIDPLASAPAGTEAALPVRQVGAAPEAYHPTATRTTVTAAQVDTPLLAAGERTKVLIYNDSDSTLYVGLSDATVTTDDYSFPVSAHTFNNDVPTRYAGAIRGIWEEATGKARITVLA